MSLAVTERYFKAILLQQKIGIRVDDYIRAMSMFSGLMLKMLKAG